MSATVYLGGSRCGACGRETPPPEHTPGAWRCEVDGTLVTESCAACDVHREPPPRLPPTEWRAEVRGTFSRFVDGDRLFGPKKP